MTAAVEELRELLLQRLTRPRQPPEPNRSFAAPIRIPIPPARDARCIRGSDDELTAELRPDSKSRFRRRNSDLISTACW